MDVKKNRENMVDYLRALAIFQVLFVHSLYWGNVFSTGILSILKSFLLFEMPLFFFVTGAAYSLSKNNSKPIVQIRQKFLRILVPY